MKSLLSEFLIFSMTFMYYVGKKKKYKEEDFFIENFAYSNVSTKMRKFFFMDKFINLKIKTSSLKYFLKIVIDFF